MINSLHKVSVACRWYGNALHKLKICMPPYLCFAFFRCDTFSNTLCFVKIAFIRESLILTQAYFSVPIQYSALSAIAFLCTGAFFDTTKRPNIEIILSTVINLFYQFCLVKALYVSRLYYDACARCCVCVIANTLTFVSIFTVLFLRALGSCQALKRCIPRTIKPQSSLFLTGLFRYTLPGFFIFKNKHIKYTATEPFVRVHIFPIYLVHAII